MVSSQLMYFIWLWFGRKWILWFFSFCLCSFFIFSPYFKTELDALEADMGMETESDGIPTYLQPDKEPNLDAELNLPSAPYGHAAMPSRSNAQVWWLIIIIILNLVTCHNCLSWSIVCRPGTQLIPGMWLGRVDPTLPWRAKNSVCFTGKMRK